jgi:hypothetical protein
MKSWLPPCEVEDDGKPPTPLEAFADGLKNLVELIDEVIGSKNTRNEEVGGSIIFALHYIFDTVKGFQVNGVTIRNNSSEPILLTHATVNVNGMEYKITLENSPVYIKPGETVNIDLSQDPSGPLWYTDAIVTFYGTRPDSCDPNLKGLITITIPKTTVY